MGSTSPVPAPRSDFRPPNWTGDEFPIQDNRELDDVHAVDGFPQSEIRRALETLLSDRRLRVSDRNRRFLRFVVEEKLAGRSERIKSYSIAVDVFGRAPTFDSIADPIVRIEATRLRTAMSNYYDQYGDDGIRIDIPKGSYIPSFIPSPPAAPPEPGRGRLFDRVPAIGRPRLIGAALCLVALVGAFFALRAFSEASHANAVGDTPVLAIEPVRNLGGGSGGEELAQGLTQSLISNLSRSPQVRLLPLQEGRASTGSGETNDVRPDYVLKANLRTGKESLRFWWQLTDARTGETLWSENVDQPEQENVSYTIEDRVSAYVAAQIAEQVHIFRHQGARASHRYWTTPSGPEAPR